MENGKQIGILISQIFISIKVLENCHIQFFFCQIAKKEHFRKRINQTRENIKYFRMTK